MKNVTMPMEYSMTKEGKPAYRIRPASLKKDRKNPGMRVRYRVPRRSTKCGRRIRIERTGPIAVARAAPPIPCAAGP